MSNPAPIFSAIDLLRMLFGVLIAAAGAGACLLFLARLNRKDYSLLYFGLGATLYGVRLFINGSAGYQHDRWHWLELLISLLVAIPFVLFFVETVAPLWRKFSWWVIGAFGAVAVFGIGNLLLGRDKVVQTAINVMSLAA
ncbi:MAG TPA: hypothetical protein VH724_11655, partial [Candidatus Angelobacter sp.]|nr:hypothetical protein [Candidatus Angelobacter sp.]